MDLLIYLIFGLFLVGPLVLQIRRTRRREREARAAAERGKLFSGGPRAQHPHIDISHCIGCGACVEVCPEGNVLAVIGGKAAIVNPQKCIGHGLCADACPVGAIEIVMANPSVTADMPRLTRDYETSVPGLFIVGELGGLALIKNAVNQGRECVDTIARRLATQPSAPGVLDVCIVGAGPAGLSASLRAVERDLTYVTLEQEEWGGTVAKYPRQKVVMTSPVEFPLHGKFNKLEISKEKLMEFWAAVIKKGDVKVRTQEKVEAIEREEGGILRIRSTGGTYRARSVILALGRRGTPRKLGIPGEELPKVMYGLIEAEAYVNARILVVGGGDSAVEAALGLAYQKGNQVTLSYRQEEFSRIKERNAQRIAEAIRTKKVRVLFKSQPVEVREHSVLIDVAGTVTELPNDWMWVFAGGEPPKAFLDKIGVAMGSRDLTREGGDEARLAKAG
ncbi:MAG TPA: NAD(P)-binding domain-containing protein, partial [Gemmatimonadales bacterium]|nr:NAD(P)-binding domain-containing protein [Gemmatimonadales bacterium]